MNFFLNLFDTSDFPARWYCGNWTEGHGWLHIVSDLGIWSAYFAIPCLLIFFLAQRKDLPFRMIFLLFGSFILLCGTTHLMEAIIFWWPGYRVAGLIKLTTAVVSWATVVALVQVVPEALKLRSPAELEREIEARKSAEQALLQANDVLETRVQERVAELAKANAELKERDARWRRFVSSGIVGVGVANREGEWLEANDELLRTIRYHRDDLEQGLRWVEMTPSEFRPLDQAAVAMADKEGSCLPYEKEYVAKDGTRVPVTIGFTTMEDTSGHYICFVLDRTSLRQTEAALKQSQSEFYQLADAIPQMAWMARPDGYVDWFNQRWFQYTGTTLAQAEGKGWTSFVDPSTVEAIRKQWEASIATGLPIDVVAPILGADGQYRPFLTRGLPLRNDAGQIIRWFGTCTDISQQQAIQEELRQVAARLSEADRRKDEFLATLAHELRNPLAPIRMGLELLKMAGDDPEILNETRSTMERQTQQLIALVDDLLDVSRITRGKLDLRKAEVDLCDVVESAVETSRPFIEESRHELKIVQPDCPVLLHADPNRLAQVISNLLNNAAKYTPEGGQITLRVEQQGERDVRISVEDTGIGIPAEMIDSIFQMFTQINRSMERSYSGLGIGLTLVKSLVEMHGGTVSVHSEGENRGSTFSVLLPVNREDQATTGSPELTDGPAPASLNGKHRVLVVDDNKAAADMLSKLVRMLGNEVRTAEDGQQAIAVAEEFRPEIILMDLGMPKMNGYEAARHIRSQAWGKEILLIALTGWGQREDRERTQQAGFNHHLVKPAEPSELQKLISGYGR